MALCDAGGNLSGVSVPVPLPGSMQTHVGRTEVPGAFQKQLLVVLPLQHREMAPLKRSSEVHLRHSTWVGTLPGYLLRASSFQAHGLAGAACYAAVLALLARWRTRLPAKPAAYVYFAALLLLDALAALGAYL